MGAPGEEQFYQEQERREEERTRREVAREQEERENRARDEAKERARENADEARRIGESHLARVHTPEGYGFSAGGGPSFLLNITEGLSLAASEAKSEPTEESFASVRFTPPPVSLMKDKSVAPGSVWEIYGIYLKIVPQLFVILLPVDPKNATALISLTATMYRNTHPIWIQASSIQPHVLKTKPVQFSLTTPAQTLSAGVEFTSPVVLGPGENLTLELNYEGQMAWEGATAGNSIALSTLVPGVGSVRYNIRPIERGTP